MMYLEEVFDKMNQPYEQAQQSLFKLMRQGLLNGAVIPEIQTDAEQAAHHMVGCDNYIAMLTLYSTAEDLKNDEPSAAAVVTGLADEHLMLLTKAILLARGPIGEHKCTGQREFRDADSCGMGDE